MHTKKQALDLLRANKQERVLRYYDELTEDNQSGILNQIEKINWSDFKLIVDDEIATRGQFSVPPTIEISEIEKNMMNLKLSDLRQSKEGKW